MQGLQKILANEYSELTVESPMIPGEGIIKKSELINAVRAIREQKLVCDAFEVLSDSGKRRVSVGYELYFPHQITKLRFEVRWIQGPDKYVGEINSFDKMAKKYLEARMYGMNLKKAHV